MAITSINDVKLAPLPGKTYFNFDREWREEFIYFLMVDRFHDDQIRTPTLTPNRTKGISAGNHFHGGKIKGITSNLDYIAGLGCTAIWLSPIFENNGNSYHGYDINNYLDVDPRFGTKQDVIDLVAAAHAYKKNGKPFPIRVILDVVINHSGDNWQYPFGADNNYSNDQQFDFDDQNDWRRLDRPIPTELRKKTLYHRKGRISSAAGWDTYPEIQHGDLYGLKDYANDDDAAGSELINVLIRAHCHWIREADVDGFRVDAIKHMGELACSRFSSNIREYAYSLGKRGFFLFGELATPDDEVIDRYIGQNTSNTDGNKTVFYGINSILDFRLAQGKDHQHPLRDILKGFSEPSYLFQRLADQEKRALNRGEIGRYLVTFLDNHDNFWQSASGRFGNGAPAEQIVAGVGYLLCALGTPCIYYGTEQGFEGVGGDEAIREAMFDPNVAGKNLLNTSCDIYQQIAAMADVVRTLPALRFGRMYFRPISGDRNHFGMPFGLDYTLAFSRLLYGSEVLVAYNVSSVQRSDSVIVDASLHKPGEKLTYRYPSAGGTVTVEQAPGGELFVQLTLKPHQFVILA